MIGFYYTGVTGENMPQKNADKSLGGYISTSPVFNGLEGNLFPGISLMDSERGSVGVRCIGLKNLGNSITLLKLSLQDGEDIKSIISLGLVKPNIDECGVPYFERIPSSNSLPTFTELEVLESGEEFEVDLSSTPWEKDTYLGLWLKREVEKKPRSKDVFDCEECNILYSKFKEGEFDNSEKEVIKLVFDFN